MKCKRLKDTFPCPQCGQAANFWKINPYAASVKYYVCIPCKNEVLHYTEGGTVVEYPMSEYFFDLYMMEDKD